MTLRKRSFAGADLTPQIGSENDAGGWCLVKHRVHKKYKPGYPEFNTWISDAKNKKRVDIYPKKQTIEQNAYSILKFTPTGDETTCFKEVQIEQHGQMMMDFRGVNLKDAQKAVDTFIPLYKQYMTLNYDVSSEGFTLINNPPVNVRGMTSCSDIANKRSEKKDCFELVLNNVKYVFAVEKLNLNAQQPYEIFDRLLLITAHSTQPHRPSGLGCDHQTGKTTTSFSTPGTSWGGGVTFNIPLNITAMAKRVASTYLKSKFDQ